MKELVRRHPILFVFSLALALRVAAVFAGAALGDDFLGTDDDAYYRMALDLAHGRDGGWSPATSSLVARTRFHVGLLELMVRAFGPVRVAADILMSVIGAAVAAVATGLAIRLTGTVRSGLIAGGIVALLPSQIAWSSTAMKDPTVWVTSILAIGVFTVVGLEHRRWVLATGGTGLALFALAYTRDHTVIVLGWALLVSSIWLVGRHGWRPIASALALLVAVPMLVGQGPAGVGLVSQFSDPGELRSAMAEGAGSAVVDTTGSAVTATDGDPSDDTATDPGPPDGWASEVGHLPYGLSIVLLQPYPWHPRNDLRFIFSKVDTLLWYPVLALAIFGGYLSLRRGSRAVVLVMFVGATASLLALFEGNLGTAFRHRGELVWACAILAAIGLEEISRRRQPVSGSFTTPADG